MSKASIEKLADRLMDEHGLTAKNWKFEWAQWKCCFGKCNHRRKTIYMSATLAEHLTPKQVRDTLLHEVAHALVFSTERHGARWQRVAKQLGVDPRATARHIVPLGARLDPNDPSYEGLEIIRVPRTFFRWVVRCPSCGDEHFRHRRKSRPQVCRACCQRYNGGNHDHRYVVEWTQIGENGPVAGARTR